jgi:hypothetical protein
VPQTLLLGFAHDSIGAPESIRPKATPYPSSTQTVKGTHRETLLRVYVTDSQRVPGAAQRETVRRRTGTPVPCLFAKQPGPRISGASLRCASCCTASGARETGIIPALAPVFSDPSKLKKSYPRSGIRPYLLPHHCSRDPRRSHEAARAGGRAGERGRRSGQRTGALRGAIREGRWSAGRRSVRAMGLANPSLRDARASGQVSQTCS